jgi:hypothetical protein
MKESVEELERQAAELHKRIAALKSEKGDEFVDSVIADLEKPGTYLEDDWGCTKHFVINPVLKYRKASKRSVEFFGKRLVGGECLYPTLNEWSSGGYDLNSFRRMMNAKSYIVHHTPRAIIDYMGKLVKKSGAGLEVLRRIVNSVASGPDAYDEPPQLWSAEEFKNATASKLIPYVLERFDKLVLCQTFDRVYYNGNEKVYYIFRVVDTGDGAAMIKCIKISNDLQFCGDWFPRIEEDYMVQMIRYQPIPKDDETKQLVAEIKRIVGECHPIKPCELNVLVTSCDSRMADSSKKFTDTVKEAVGYTK